MSSSTKILLAELADGKPHRVEVGGEAVCVAKVNGEVFAIGDSCSHANVSLSEGELEGHHVECWLHGSRFDLRTGIPDSPPATVALPTYSVSVNNGIVLIEGKR